MRIETRAREAGVTIAWRPFLLGPIFKKQGWDTSPFNLHPAKGRYMWRDVARQCERYGLPLSIPNPFPQHSLLATRIAFCGQEQSWIGEFTRSVYSAEFGQGLDISDEGLLANMLLDAGAPAKRIIEDARTAETKSNLRDTVEEAEKHGIFGAPSFILPNGELFWGDDRLDQALESAKRLTVS
ncbi:2-hydroxychromene-2-carboxylate isomerase [Roseibium sp. SCP15]|uniref:2-hydroxychromene-2-carboxylate isomerase n=1 Tax=Roseibium sp. SCP15 TaxID=3141376 RepID=UPI003A981EA6